MVEFITMEELILSKRLSIEEIKNQFRKGNNDAK